MDPQSWTIFKQASTHLVNALATLDHILVDVLRQDLWTSHPQVDTTTMVMYEKANMLVASVPGACLVSGHHIYVLIDEHNARVSGSLLLSIGLLREGGLEEGMYK